MVTLPNLPQSWNDEFPRTQETLPSDPNNASGGLLGGLQSPDWSLENSGLGFLFHPQTIAQMDLGDGQDFAASPPHIEPVAAKTSGHREPTMAFTVPAFEIPTVKLDDLGPLPPLLPPRVPYTYSPSPFEKGMDALGSGPVGKAWDQFSDTVRGALRSEWGDRILTAVEKSADTFEGKGDLAEKAGMGSGTFGTIAGKDKYVKFGSRGMDLGSLTQGIGDVLGGTASLGRQFSKTIRLRYTAGSTSLPNPHRKILLKDGVADGLSSTGCVCRP